MRLLLILLLLPLPALAQRVQADVRCKPAGQDYIYNCVITLAHNGEPLDGAQVSVGADMPSMPMAHNVKPVKARPGKNPGEYLARLDLEMQGEWLVKLRISGPVRDQVVKKLRFN